MFWICEYFACFNWQTKLTICEGRDEADFADGDVLIFPEMIKYRYDRGGFFNLFCRGCADFVSGTWIDINYMKLYFLLL